MTLERDLRLIFTDGSSPDPQSTDCKEAIDRLSTLANVPKNVGPSLGTLFNEEWGLITSIRLYRRAKWSIAKQLLRSLSKIIEHAGTSIAPYTEQILTVCEELDTDRDSAALIGGEIFTQLVSLVPWAVKGKNVVWNFFKRYLRYLSLWDTSFQHIKYAPFFDVIELMVNSFHEDLEKIRPAFKQLWDVLASKLQAENLDVNPSARVLVTLTKYYSPDEGQCRDLYVFFKSNLDDIDTRTNSSFHEAMLNFFPKFMSLFGGQLSHEYEYWHGLYVSHLANQRHERTYIPSSYDDHPIAEFYQGIFKTNMIPTPAFIRYFTQHLMDRVLHYSLQPYDAVYVIKWSDMVRLRSPVYDVDVALSKLVNFLSSSFWPGVDTCPYVACVLGAFNLMRKDYSLLNKYFGSLVGILANLAANYKTGSDFILNTLEVCLTNLISNEYADAFHQIVSLTLLKISANNTSYDLLEFWSQFFRNDLGEDKLLLDAMSQLFQEDDLENMKPKVFQILLETVVFLCNQLNFSVTRRKSKESISHDSQMVLDSPGDVALFTNLVHLCGGMKYFTYSKDHFEWLLLLLVKTVKLCSAYPFSIPLARLLSIILRRLPKGTFSRLDLEYVSHIHGNSGKFIKNCFEYAQVFSGDRQKAYIEVVLNLPCSALSHHHESFLPFFRTTFLVAQNDPKLAEDAIRGLRKWTLHFGKEEMYDTILDVMPTLSSLVKLAPERRKINRPNENGDMQKELFLFLGLLGPEFIEKFYSSFRTEVPRGSSLSIKISFGDLPYDLNLSTLLPDTLLLASQSSDFEERLRSCELLSVITRYIIGICGRVEGENELIAQTFKIVMIRVLELAHDSQPEIRGLFGPLVVQCENLFSRKIPCYEVNRAFIEALLDRVMLSTREETTLQCCQFLNHLVESTSSANVQKVNVELIMDSIHRYMFSVEPAQRRGAAIALNSVIDSLMKQSWSYDKYCFLVIYLAITCLCTSNPSVYVIEVLDEVGNRIRLDRNVLDQPSDARVVPPGFNSADVTAMMAWLLKQATSFNTLTAKECARLMSQLTTLDHVVGGLIERLEGVAPYLLSPETDGDFNKVVKNTHLDCILSFYVYCVQEEELRNLGAWRFSASEKVLSIVGLVLRNCEKQQEVTISPANVFEAHGFYEQQSQDDLIFATIQITIFLQQYTDPKSMKFLQSLLVDGDLNTIYYKFICHPSQLMIVGNGFKPYHDLSTTLWNFITDHEILAMKFMEKLSAEIENLTNNVHLQLLGLHSASDATSPKLPTSCYSDSELVHFLSRTDFSRVRSLWRDLPMDHWIQVFFEACNCDKTSDQDFQANVPHFAQYLKFFFTLMPPEVVFRKLFGLLPQSKGRFYFAFESLWLDLIRMCGDRFDWWIVDIEKDITILQRMLDKFDTFCQGDGFPTAVKESLHTFLTNNANWCVDENKKQSMFTLLCSLGNAFSSPAGCFVGTAMEFLIRGWVDQEANQIYLRLIPFLSPQMCEEYKNANSVLTDINDKGTDVLKSIFTSCLYSGHYNLVLWCICQLYSNGDLLCPFLEMILPLFPSFKATTQEKILCRVYKSALLLELPIQDQLFYVISHLIESATNSVRKAFYMENWEAMRTSIFDTDLRFPHTLTLVANDRLKKLSINLVLVAKMYGIFEKEDLFGEGGIMNLGVEDGRKFGRDLLQRCYNFQTHKPIQGTLCQYHPTVWRQFQCSAFNCLIVLLCDTKMVGKVLNHFVFHDFKSGSHVLNSIIYDYNPQFCFITWEGAKNLKYRQKKSVDTGIKNSLKLRNARAPQLYSDVSVPTISQDCKAFDFIHRQTTYIPDDLTSTIVEVAMDGDVLDSHPCLPYLCSLLYKTLECGLIPTTSETIPDWMNSFTKLLLDARTKPNAKCLIVKVVHRCQEVLKPFWSAWYIPVLHALSSGYCGDGNTHFFYKVAKMLVTWNPPREEGSIELLSWGRVVKLLLGGICTPNDASHLLRLLRWIAKFRCDLQPPYEILTRILTVDTLRESSLEAYIILFENEIIPYRDDASLKEIFGIVANMRGEEMMEKKARVIGYLVKSATNPTTKKELFDETCTNLRKLSDSNVGTFFKQLCEMSHSFSQIGEEFTTTVLSCLENPKHRVLYPNCLAVLDNVVKNSTTPDLFKKLKKSKFLSSGHLNASALSRGMNILGCFVSLGDKYIDDYISNFLKERIDGSDIKQIPRYVKSEMYRLAVATFKSLDEDIREWLFERFFVEKSPIVLEEIVSHVAEQLTRTDCAREATLLLLEAMARAPFTYNASWCLLSAILGRSYLSYRPENTIVGSRAYAISEAEAAGLLEVPSSSPGECALEFGARLASIDEEEDFEAPSPDRTMVLLPQTNECGKPPPRLPKTAVSYQELLLSVTALSKKSRKFINTTFTSVFNSIFSTPLNPNHTRRLDKICQKLLEGFLGTQTDDALPSFLLKLCRENRINLPQILLYNLCQSYELDELGILMTETRVLAAPPLISWRSAPLEVSDYYASLTMFYENLGFEDVIDSLKATLPPKNPNAVNRGGPSECVTEMYYEQAGLKALAALAKWDQLDKLVTKSSSENTEQYSLQHNLGFHILSETNRMIKEDSNSLGETISSWLNDEKNNKSSVEKRFQSEKSMLHLLKGDRDEFRATSKTNAANWTYWRVLSGNFHSFRHGTATKKILDNYTMAEATSDLSDYDAFNSQLSFDDLYFPADPIQWNQIITNRERFLYYLKRTERVDLLFSGREDQNDEFVPNDPHIQHLRIAFLKFLIDKRQILKARSFASFYSREPHYESSLEAAVLHLAESKFDPFLQQYPQLEVDRVLKTWDIIAPKLSCRPSSLLVEDLAVEVNFEFLSCLSLNVELDTSGILGTMAKNLGLTTFDCLRNVHASDSQKLTYSIKYLYDIMEADIKKSPATSIKSAHMLSDHYYKYAKFNLDHRNSVTDGHVMRIGAVKGALSYLAVTSSPDVVMFLRALEVACEDFSDDMEQEFRILVCTIPLLRLEVLLPQIMGYYAMDPRKIPVLQPVVDYFMASCPELVILHTLPYLEYDEVERNILQRLQLRADMNTANRLSSFLKLVDALSMVCNPKAILKDFLSRMMEAESEEKMMELKNELINKCFYPNSEMIIGTLYSVTSSYLGLWLEELCRMKMNNVPLGVLLREISLQLGETKLTEKQYNLEEFSPFLKRFDLAQIKFPMLNQSGGRKLTTFVKIYPGVKVYNTLREPIEIKVLASDGRDHRLILKFGDDLRQDQLVQLAFRVMNSAFKRRADWDHTSESIVTYNVMPLSPRFGMIEKREPTLPLIQALKQPAAEGEDEMNWRFKLLARHHEWLEEVQRENPDGREVRLAVQLARLPDLERVLADRANEVPPDLFRKFLQNYSNSPRDYFYKRSNFLRSHAVLSFCHWVLGIADRHLSNFIVEEDTCRLVGIDFGFAFGEKMEYLNSPELIPFRLTPQFESIYRPFYLEAILKRTMAKCFSSVDGDDLEVIMRILKLAPLKYSSSSKTDLENVQDNHARMIEMLKRKLSLENPVGIIEDYVRAAPYDEEVKEAFCGLLQRIQVPAQFSSVEDVISALISISSDKAILTILPSVFEPWI